MKIIKYINQHIPIWSMLDGDHALKEEVKKLSVEMIENPDLLNPLENKLRYSLFSHKRDWIAATINQNTSFALIKISYEELLNVNTCFSEAKLVDFADEYIRANKRNNDFNFKRTKGNITKSNFAVKEEIKLRKKLDKIKTSNISSSEVLNTNNKNSNIWIATNRSMIMKDENKELKIMDGTHRLVAYIISKTENKNKLPNHLYAFHWERSS